MTFNRTLQGACAVFGIHTLFQQEIFCGIRTKTLERTLRISRHDARLHAFQFNTEDLIKVFARKRPEDDNFVNPIHEFRRKLVLWGLDSNATDLTIDGGKTSRWSGRKADTAGRQ